MMIKNGSMAVVILAALAVAFPTTQDVRKRWTEGEDCTSNSVNPEKSGLFFAVASDGTTLECDDIDKDVNAKNGCQCYVTNLDSEDLGDLAQCPGDPAPSKNPDGSDTDPSLAEDLMDTYCKIGAGPSFFSVPACLQFGYWGAHGDIIKETMEGAKAVCDIWLAGTCTYFMDLDPGLDPNAPLPCFDDPDGDCGLIGPGK